jgi:hypothetical protein
MEHRDPVSADTLLAAVATMRPPDLGVDGLRDARARLIGALARGREAGAHTPEAAWRACVEAEADDPVPGARTGLVAPFAWLREPGRTVSLDAAATAGHVADLVGSTLARGLRGRIPREEARARALMGAAAAAGGWLRAVDAGTLSRIVARALAAAPEDLRDPAALAAAARTALDGAPGDEAIDVALERVAPGAAASVPDAPRSLAVTPWFRTFPGPLAAGTALEAVDVVLKRHLRAADKRLRADQVERIDVHLAWPAWEELRDGTTLATLVGRLVATHTLDAAWHAAAPPEAEAVAERVVVHHDWRLSARLLRAVEAEGEAMPTLRAGLTELRRTRAVPALHAADLHALLGAAAPWRRGGVAGGAASPPAPGPWKNPVRIELSTTRGGRWPVRLDAPSVVRAVASARARHPDADRLLDADGTTDVRDWARAVLA